MELYANIFCPFRLHEANRLIVIEGHLRIRAVMANENVILSGEFNDLLEKVQSCHGAGGIIGIINPQYPGIL